jgi:hypothetical protein
VKRAVALPSPEAVPDVALITLMSEVAGMVQVKLLTAASSTMTSVAMLTVSVSPLFFSVRVTVGGVGAFPAPVEAHPAAIISKARNKTQTRPRYRTVLAT